MQLAVMPPVKPMLAKAVAAIPRPESVEGLRYEPKWDGFRCIVFRNGEEPGRFPQLIRFNTPSWGSITAATDWATPIDGRSW